MPSRRLRVQASGVLVVCALASCSFMGEDDASSGLAAVDLVDQVELIVAGDEPRSVVRYRFDGDDKFVAVSTDLVRVSQQVVASGGRDRSESESDAPFAAELDATIVTETQVTARPTDGAVESGAELYVVDREIIGASVGDATSPTVAAAVAATVEDRIGTRTEQVVDERGWRYDGRTSASGDQADSSASPVSEAVSASAVLGVEAVSVGVDIVALPDEPIGEGAKWKTSTTFDGVDGSQTAFMLVNVVDLDRDAQGHLVSLTLEIEMSSDQTEAAISAPGAEVEQAGSGLTGTVVVDVVEPVHEANLSSWAAQVAPTEGLFAGSDDVVEEISDQSVHQRVEVESTVDVRR